MVDWLAGKRVRGTSSERTPLGTGLGGTGVGGWVEVGRTTLEEAGDTIDVTSLPNKRYYMYLMNLPLSGRVDHYHRLNGDILSNYSYRRSIDGATPDVTGAGTGLFYGSQTVGNMAFSMGYIANRSANEKLVIHQHVDNQAGTGAGYAPRRIEGVGKHVQTSSPVTGLLTFNGDSGDYSSGAEVVVLGWDPDDTHTNNFWEELASVSGTNVSSLNTGTITAKKYLWIQIVAKNVATGSNNYGLQFNNDQSSNYIVRLSSNGGSDITGSADTKMQLNYLNPEVPTFTNIFVINASANEKLFIYNGVSQNTAGQYTPHRLEWVGKWANTLEQITNIKTAQYSGNITGEMKVWGAD